MSDELASSPSTASCAESAATLFDTTRKPPARINLCASPARTTRQTICNGELGDHGGNGVWVLSGNGVDEFSAAQRTATSLDPGHAGALEK